MPREFPEDVELVSRNRRNLTNKDAAHNQVLPSRTIELDSEVDATAKDFGPNPYKKWIHMARAFDAWRPFPRLFIGIYIYILHRSIEWYLALPDPTLEQSGFISVIVGAGAAWFGLYVGSGRHNR